ncbi:hypothetical protein AKJ65_03135 [candidate division MSBL1 archaeon SCGC-AAA259E19]|uniref:Sodium:solute symporter n=1 Tax=candidate division MSBL1 archaeon SCGC-AAA259E19 TaxID=1698264 RepID=A0A133UKZ3_9EURY|nr:hypothetical protein AKJ65_03135 [candidate division MSBL1 archaeon SCGC-AAA259E19]
MRPLYLFMAIALWAVVGLWIAHMARKKMGKGIPEFYIAGRRVSGFISGMTYAATTYSAFMMIGLVGWVYSEGVAVAGMEMTYLIFTVLFLIIFAPRFWTAGREYGYTTPPDLLSDRYNSEYVGSIASILALVTLVPYAAAQLMGAGALFNVLSGREVPYIVGVLTMAGFSGVTALWAGFRSVSWTDAFQAITMIVTSVILVFYVFYHFFGSPTAFFSTITSHFSDKLELTWGLQEYIGWSLPWAFFALSNPQVSQRMFVSEDITSLKRMIIYFSIFGFAYTIITTLLGLAAVDIVPNATNFDAVMPALLNRVPVVLSLVVFVGIFAAATSTLGSILLTLSSLGTENVVRPLRPSTSETTRVIIGRLIILGLLGVCVFFAVLRPSMIGKLAVYASGGLAVSVPSIFGAFFWGDGTAQGAIWSIVIGGSLTIVLILYGINPLGVWHMVWGLMISTILYFLISSLTESPEGAGEFIENIEREISKSNF